MKMGLKIENTSQHKATFIKKWKAKMTWKPGDEWCMRPEEDADILYWCSGFWLRNYSHYWKYMAENEKPVLCLLSLYDDQNHEVSDYL